MLRLTQDHPAVAAVLVHVSEPEAGRAWYGRAFPEAQHLKLEDGFELLQLQGTSIEIVPADEKVQSGPAGSVVYWRVQSFDEALSHLNALGAVLYRGPMNIEQGQRMCQVRDPWGNCIGIRGK
jgi:predicted enzyme related to lactoylglutathione lyase